MQQQNEWHQQLIKLITYRSIQTIYEVFEKRCRNVCLLSKLKSHEVKLDNKFLPSQMKHNKLRNSSFKKASLLISL